MFKLNLWKVYRTKDNGNWVLIFLDHSAIELAYRPLPSPPPK